MGRREVIVPLAVFVVVVGGILGFWAAFRKLPRPARKVADATTKPTPSFEDLCNDDWAVYGDFDGDKRLDRAYSVQMEDGPHVGVCLATGQHSAVRGSEGSVFEVLDLEGDGIDEVLYGGTTVSSAGGTVASIVDGTLLDVLKEDFGTFDLSEGHGSNGKDHFEESWGCRDVDGNGRREVIVTQVMHVFEDEGRIWRPTGPWKVFTYRLEDGWNRKVALLIDLQLGDGPLDAKRRTAGSCESPRSQLVHPEVLER